MDNKEMSIEELQEKYDKLVNESESIGSLLRRKKQEAENRRKEKLAAAKEARKKEIEEKEKELSKLIHEYVKDYGSYSMSREYHEDNAPYLWHMFF